MLTLFFIVSLDLISDSHCQNYVRHVILFFLKFCLFCFFFFFFKQKTAYEIYQCDWSSDVCSSDLVCFYRLIFRGIFFTLCHKRFNNIIVSKNSSSFPRLNKFCKLTSINRFQISDVIPAIKFEIGRASCRERV